MNRKLEHCRVCGNVVAKAAKVCPQCGAKRNRTAQISVASVAVVFTVILCAVIVSSINDLNKPVPAASQSSQNVDTVQQPEQEIAVTTAKELYQTYQENEVNADNLYKNQLIAVSGTVKSIQKSLITDTPCVSLDCGSAYGIYHVECFFEDIEGNNSVISELREGDEITIYGTCTGFYFGDVQLSDCYILN